MTIEVCAEASEEEVRSAIGKLVGAVAVLRCCTPRQRKRPGLSSGPSEGGIKGLHFHDLRHTGNTFAAATGASTRELMTRMGHSTARAAPIYQLATAGRERLIGQAVSAVVEQARKQDPKPNGHAAGTQG
jgi:hypothetical protein